MNLLTKSLLEDLLDTKKTVAIYGGGFKPPTKGHFNVAELALSELPDIDELKIFVGGGVRDGITQDESIQVWDIYKKYLSPKVSVEPSVAPVKSVLGYAKENPDAKVYWVLGARDGEESDLMDIANRTKTINKYPNLEVKVITSKGGISGTKTRTAIKANNKEQFFHFIPDIEEKEQVWDIVSPVVKEVEMGMIPTDVLGKHTQQDMDSFMTNIKDKFQKFISALKQEGQETKKAISLLIKSAKGDIELSDEQKEQIGNQLKDVLKTIGLTAIAVLPGGFIAGALIKLFKAEALITPSAFVNEVGEANLKPYKWEEVDREGYYVYTRFVTDSETQYDVDIKSTIFFPAGQMESLPALEIEFSAKPKGAEGSSAKIVVNKGEMYRVMATIVDIIKKYLKKSKAQAIIYSPSKKSSEENFGVQRDQLYRAFISKAIPGVTFKQSGDFITAILPSVKEGTCGYDTDVKTGKKLDTPGGLEEGKQVGTLYHYTSADGLKGILSSNSIKASEEIYMGQNLYYISFTRNKNFHKKGSKFGVKTEYRITLDGDKLSNKYKITPHAYKPGYDYTENWEYDWLEDEPENVVRDFFAATGEYDEQEERISFKGPEGGIDNIKNYILSVDKVEDLQEALNDPFGLNELARQFLKEAFKQTLNKNPLEVQTKKININFELWTGRKISEDIILAMSPDSQGLFSIGDNIEKSTGLSLKDAKKYNESPDDAYIYGLVNTMNDDQDIFFWTNGTRLAGKAKELGAWPAVIEQLAHEGLHLARAILAKSLMGDKFPTGEWPSMGEQDNDTIEEEELTTSVSFVIEQIAPSFIKMAEKYIPELKLPSIQENKLFSLNKSIKQFLKEALIETWNPEESFVSLSQYMMDNGMNIKPLPKIKVIKDDEQNASDLLGKTAYYNPTEKSITLYTMDRHPKDILRSFAHEMVHHEQNLDGRLGNINTTNTNEDGDLPEIEREAYEKGNMMLRNWEDKIKNV
jgi:hypothetical protein